MTNLGNVAVVQTAYAAFAEANAAKMLDACADDVVWFHPGSDSLVPVAGEFRGRVGVEEFFELLRADETIRQFEPREFLQYDDRVIVLGCYTSRINSTGREYYTDFVHIFTLRDGKIIRFQDFFDTAAELEAYGTLVFP